MEHPLIHNRGRGPELVGTRITIFNLVGDFFSPNRTESQLCEDYCLTPEQVAAMRAYLLHNFTEVMAENARIDERIRVAHAAQQNDPVLQAKFAKTRENAGLFREWLAHRESLGLPIPRPEGDPYPSFRDWLAARTAPTVEVG